MNTAAICAGIAAISVTGVTVKDIDEIPEVVSTRDVPILYPQVDQFTSGGNDEGPSTFGAAGARYWEHTQTMRYLYLHAIAGSGRGINDHVAPLLVNRDALVEQVMELDIAGVDILGVTVSAFGVFTDPSESQRFIGFTLDIRAREKVNP
jgi:hypothetical protein